MRIIVKHVKSMVACGIIQVIDVSDTVAGRKYEPEYMNGKPFDYSPRR